MKGESMSKPKTGKGSLTKADIKVTDAALPTDKPTLEELEKQIFPIRFKQGKDKNTVANAWDLDSQMANALRKTFATNDSDLWEFYSCQLASCADSRNDAAKNLNQLVPILHNIAPKDALETMLAVQMVGLHNVAINCLSRAISPQQTFEGRQANLNYATRLLRTFTAQMDALQRYRGKGTQQKVTVEHVHVHQGGQAIVGAVNHQGKEGGGGDDGQS
jgi:hypothetical protein